VVQKEAGGGKELRGRRKANWEERHLFVDPDPSRKTLRKSDGTGAGNMVRVFREIGRM